MKEKLILGAIVLLLVSWLALDAVATIILPLRFAALPLAASSHRPHASLVRHSLVAPLALTHLAQVKFSIALL